MHKFGRLKNECLNMLSNGTVKYRNVVSLWTVIKKAKNIILGDGPKSSSKDEIGFRDEEIEKVSGSKKFDDMISGRDSPSSTQNAKEKLKNFLERESHLNEIIERTSLNNNRKNSQFLEFNENAVRKRGFARRTESQKKEFEEKEVQKVEEKEQFKKQKQHRLIHYQDIDTIMEKKFAKWNKIVATGKTTKKLSKKLSKMELKTNKTEEFDKFEFHIQKMCQKGLRTSFELRIVQEQLDALRYHYKLEYPNGDIYLTGCSKLGYSFLSDMAHFVTFQNTSNIDSIKVKDVFTESGFLKKLLTSLNFSFNVVDKNGQILHFKAPNFRFSTVMYIGSSQRLLITSLINIYMQLDPRFMTLVLWLKLWFRNYSSFVNMKSLISDDAIVLLALFYLQASGVLPNLHSELPNLVTKNRLLNLSLSDMPAYVIEKPEVKVKEMFFGFMKFYKDFDWRNKTIDIKENKIMESDDSVKRGVIREPFFSNCFLDSEKMSQASTQINDAFENILHHEDYSGDCFHWLLQPYQKN